MSKTSSSNRRSGLALSPSTARGIRIAVTVCILAGLALVAAAPAGAAPTFDDSDVTIEDDESWIGIEDEHTIAIEASDVDTTDGPATVSVDLSEWEADAIGSDPNVEVLTDGVEIVGDVETDGAETTFEVDDTDEAIIDLEAEIEVAIEHPRESSFDGAEYGSTVEIGDAEGTATGSAGVTLRRLSYEVGGEERFPPSTEFVFQNQMATVTNLEPGTDYTLFEFDAESERLGDPIESVDPSGSAAEIETADGPLETGWYIVYDDDHIAPIEENAFRVQTHTLDATQAQTELDSTGDGAETSVRLDSPLRTTQFDVTVTSAELDADELFEVFDGSENDDVERVGGSDEAITIEGVNAGDEIPMTAEPISAASYGFEYTATDTNASDTTSVTVEEREVGAEFGSDVFETQAGGIVEVDLSLEDTDEGYVMIGGDRASGESALTNYFDILHVDGGATVRINTRLLGTNVPSEEVYVTEGGSVTSYLHDPNDDAFEDVTFEGDADDLEEFRSEIGIHPLSRPLQPGRYRLVAGLEGSVVLRDDGIPDFERPLARSNLLVTESEGFGNVTTYVAPAGGANEIDDPEDLGELTGELTERRTVAKGDRIVFEIEARGVTGVVSWLTERMDPDEPGIAPTTLAKLLEFPDGLRVDGEQTNPEMNERVTTLDVGGASDGELYLVPEPMTENGSARYFERYYLVVDTRETGPFDREPRPGDEYRFRMGYNSTGETDWFDAVDHDRLDPNGAPPHVPYDGVDATNRTETRFVTIEEPTVEYDRTESRDRPIVRNSADGTLSGTTNFAPGTETTIQLVADDRTRSTRITIEDVEIDSEGAFDVNHDFSALEPGEAIEAEFYVDQRLLDKRAALVIGEDDDLVRYEITDHTENAAITEGERLEDVFATVENRGVMADSQSVELAIDGESVGDRRAALDGSESETVEFGDSTADLEPGEYTYSISTDDDEASGRLLVEDESIAGDERERTGEDEAESEESDQPEGRESPDRPDEPSDDEDDDDPSEPSDGLFGMVPALPIGPRSAVAGTAVVGAVHVLGHWG